MDSSSIVLSIWDTLIRLWTPVPSCVNLRDCGQNMDSSSFMLSICDSLIRLWTPVPSCQFDRRRAEYGLQFLHAVNLRETDQAMHSGSFVWISETCAQNVDSSSFVLSIWEIPVASLRRTQTCVWSGHYLRNFSRIWTPFWPLWIYTLRSAATPDNYELDLSCSGYYGRFNWSHILHHTYETLLRLTQCSRVKI
jgi:hypothetical protein